MSTEKNKRTDEILKSIDGINRASAPDFFYTRLKAKLDRLSERPYESGRRSWLLHPAYALATLIVVLLINAFVLLKNDGSAKDGVQDEGLTSIAAEYNLNDNGALYEINQER
jgi:hypothetical protein